METILTSCVVFLLVMITFELRSINTKLDDIIEKANDKEDSHDSK